MSWHRVGRGVSVSSREGAVRLLADRIGGEYDGELAWEAVVEFASRLVLLFVRGEVGHAGRTWVAVAV